MKNAEYWKRRMKASQDAIQDSIFDEYVSNVREQYDLAIKDIEEKIRAWYQRFADNNEISYSEAQRLLKSDELKEFRWTVEEYIKHGKENGISADWAKELENASARVHISRLESLEFELRAHAEELTAGRIKNTMDAAGLAYSESYNHTAFEFQKQIGVGVSMQGIDSRKLEKLLAKPWSADGSDFTARCWTDKEKLVEAVNRELTRMVATGAAPDKAISNIAKLFETSKRNAGRVVMTEASYFSAVAQKDCFRELGVEQFEVVGTFDTNMCELCAEMNGQVFPMSKFEPGVTANPFHPWCRCTTMPYFEDMEEAGKRFARDAKTGETFEMPANATYADWKKMQEEKYGEGFIDTERKKRYNRNTDKEQFERYKSVLRDMAPKSFEEFQQIKTNKPEEWNTLKHQYRILNQYKIDSGSLSAKELYELDDRVITEKRNNFISKYKRSGNIAGAYINNDNSKMYFAHSLCSKSKKGYNGTSELVLLKENRRFKYIDVLKSNGEIRSQTWEDTEAKLFEYFADMYEEKPFKAITMLSERGMCDSCKGVMKQFKERFPDLNINVVSNKHVEGNVWGMRRRKKK